ncbi:Uncharacterised protein [Mycobacterium tuberculosis]|nr:Uncharacterised protein [Mycobacterium tuberculosis]
MTETLSTAAAAAIAARHVAAADDAPTDSVLINPAPKQMAQLDFLLGEYRGETTPVPDEGPLQVIMQGRKILDGNFYEVKLVFPTNTETGAVVAYWDFGWDSVNGRYVAQYADNLGSYGTVHSPGWEDGSFRFTGEYLRVIIAGGESGSSTGEWITSTDSFSITESGRLVDDITYIKDGNWEPCGRLVLDKVSTAS